MGWEGRRCLPCLPCLSARLPVDRQIDRQTHTYIHRCTPCHQPMRPRQHSVGNNTEASGPLVRGHVIRSLPVPTYLYAPPHCASTCLPIPTYMLPTCLPVCLPAPPMCVCISACLRACVSACVSVALPVLLPRRAGKRVLGELTCASPWELLVSASRRRVVVMRLTAPAEGTHIEPYPSTDRQLVPPGSCVLAPSPRVDICRVAGGREGRGGEQRRRGTWKGVE